MRDALGEDTQEVEVSKVPQAAGWPSSYWPRSAIALGPDHSQSVRVVVVATAIWPRALRCGAMGRLSAYLFVAGTGPVPLP